LRQPSRPRLGAAVTLLEAGSRVGQNILASGSRRCNLTHTGVAPDAYDAPEFVAPVLAECGCQDVLVFFGDLGLLTYADDEGRVYPVTNAANSVLDVLRLEYAHLGVVERFEFEVALPGHTLSLDTPALAHFRLPVIGTGYAAQAQVTRGGAQLAGFDPATMAPRVAPGVFAAGEVLDVDGRCGGFNLHWAWASGIVADKSAVRQGGL